MTPFLRSGSAESYALVMAIAGIIMAAVLSYPETLRFGSFWMMAGAFLAGSLAWYAAVKAKLLKPPRERNRSS